MYSKQLMAAGGGIFAFGALIGWAITADHWDRKNKALQKVLDAQHIAIETHINSISDRIVEAPVATEEELISHQHLLEDLRPDQVRLNGISLVSEEPNSNYGVHPVSLITDDEGEPISYISEGYGVGTDANSDPENSPEGNVDESLEHEDRFEPGEPEEKTTTRLTNLIAQYAANPENVDQFVAIGRKAVKHVDEIAPYVISMADYAAGEVGDDEYAKITLEYYPNERVMLDDEEEALDPSDIDAMVGWRNLNSFGNESGDPDVVFIRNERLRTDFEIVKDEENELPIHVRYGMAKNVYEANVKAGHFRFREEDSD